MKEKAKTELGNAVIETSLNVSHTPECGK